MGTIIPGRQLKKPQKGIFRGAAGKDTAQPTGPWQWASADQTGGKDGPLSYTGHYTSYFTPGRLRERARLKKGDDDD
jgi:hypothetical protein